MIFVFGSNLAGIHGAGATKTALQLYGAVKGVGEGRRGNSYALPTKDHFLKTLSLEYIEKYSVHNFLAYARIHEKEEFFLTAVGCGLAGYTPEQIAPMFASAPKNVKLPRVFREVLGVKG